MGFRSIHAHYATHPPLASAHVILAQQNKVVDAQVSLGFGPLVTVVEESEVVT